MSAIAGLLSQSNASQNLDAKGDLVGEYQDTILVRNSKGMNAGSTLFGLMSRLKAEPAEATEFNWFERNPVTRQVYVSATDSTSVTVAYQVDTTLSASIDAAYTSTASPLLPAGTVLSNMTTGEYIMVVADSPTNGAIVGGSTSGVLRAINGVTGAVMTQGDILAIITLGKEDGASPTRAQYEQPSVLTNFVQTFNSSINLTNAFKANKLRSDIGGPLKQTRIQALERIAKDIEMGFLVGKKNRITGADGQYIYFTGGVKDAIDSQYPANALNGGGASGTSYASNVAPWMQGFMTYGSDAKLAFCGPTAYSAFSALANSATNGFRIMNQETVWGMNITVINTPFGELDLAFHPLFQEMPAYTSWIVVVDLAHVMQKTLEPLFLEPNIQIPGTDIYQEQFRAKLGLKLRFAQAFGYAKNLFKIAA